MQWSSRFLTVVVFTLLGGGFAAAEEPYLTYSIKKSEVSVPANVPIGKYRRIIQPFEDWTLVCDENLKAMRRICNVTQSVVDQSGVMIFSWSLAATAEGMPVVIVRTPASVGKGTAVSLTPSGAKQPRQVKLSGCDADVCVGFVPLDASLRGEIDKGGFADVSFAEGAARVALHVPLKGLQAAVAAIK